MSRHLIFKDLAMPQAKLQGFQVAFLTTDGFEQSELFEPRKALQAAVAETLAGRAAEGFGARLESQGAEQVAVDQALEAADPKSFNALLLPGGVMNPDSLRMQPRAVAFVSHSSMRESL